MPDLRPTTRQDLEDAFRDCYTGLRGCPPPEFSVHFYPYSGLRHTIRVRGQRILVRISDILEEAPREVLRALVVVLVHRLFRSCVPEAEDSLYRRFVETAEVRVAIRRVRAQRSRKLISPACGQVFDLSALFAALNEEYFDGRIQIRNLGWSLGASRRVLGHYDPAHRTIILNRRLDHPLVPGFVVEYVLYHEMVHADLDGEAGECGRRPHNKRFRQAEEQFRRFKAAREFIRSSL